MAQAKFTYLRSLLPLLGLGQVFLLSGQSIVQSDVLPEVGSSWHMRALQSVPVDELPIGPLQAVTAKVVLLHDYESGWVANEQRHTQAWSYWKQMMLFYSTLRRLGVDVDIRHPDADLSAYAVIVAPCLQDRKSVV